MTTWAATGHRPPKLGGYTTSVSSRLLVLANEFLTSYKPETLIVGMALGWDQEIAYAAIKANVKVIAAIPFCGQEKVWPEASRYRYLKILENCHEVVVVTEGGFSAEKMRIRNEWMVDHCDQLVALWDKQPSSGTTQAVRYATANQTPVTNLWDRWLEL